MSTEVFQIVSQPSFDVNVPARRGGRTKRIYRCRHCARVFKRSEHCARHERVHTQERPFPCGFCDRRYARKDLVKRHERSLHAEEYRRAHPEEFRRSSFAGVENALSGEEESSGSTNTRQPPSPLTPPGATSPLTNYPIGTNGTANLNFSNPPMMAPSLGHMSDTNLITTSQLMNNTLEADYYAPEIDFGPPNLQSDLPSYAFHPDPMGIESSPKRRRIEMEVDPQLLLDDQIRRMSQSITMEAPSQHNLSLQQTNLSPIHFNDFPLGENDLPGTHSGPESDALPTPTYDISAEYSAFFEFDTSLALPQLQSTVSEMASLPQVQKEKCSELPRFEFDQMIHQKICDDARSRLPAGELSEALFPTINDLNRFFSGYLECFHRHFPIIHLPSLDILETPSPLIFAVCSIGAQYRLSRQKAKNMFALAGTMSSYALRGGLPIMAGTPKPAPLWIMQTRVLLSLCGMFSGKTNVVLRTIENLGLFAIDYRLRRSLLNHSTESPMTWEEWISRESSKRLLCGMFIVSNLISTTFGINPGFSHTSDLEFEVLDEERLWNAQSADEWMQNRDSRTCTSGHTVRDTMADLIFDNQSSITSQPHQISSLTMLLVTHAVNIHMWSLTQLTELSGGFNSNSSNPAMQEMLLTSASTTLSRCQAIISSAWSKHTPTSPTWTEAEGPLMFNCQGLLMTAYIRLFSNISAFNRLTLLTDNPEDIKAAVEGYVGAQQERGEKLTEVVRRVYERLLATVRIGHLLLRKTAALSWSLEHAVAGWDATLLLTSWTHAVETDSLLNPPNAEESQILDGLKSMLAETESPYDGTGSLAAAVAQFCSSTLDDVWVWGVTPRMGNILMQLGIAYEENYRTRMGVI